MHIITQKRIWQAKIKHPRSSNSLDCWYRIVKKNNFANFSTLKQVFNTVDKVGCYYIFDIGGNKIRLIANIHFNRQKIYIRAIISHIEYEKNNWQKE